MHRYILFVFWNICMLVWWDDLQLFQGCLLRQLALTLTDKIAFATREEKKGQRDSITATLLLLDSQHKNLKFNHKSCSASVSTNLYNMRNDSCHNFSLQCTENRAYSCNVRAIELIQLCGFARLAIFVSPSF